VDILGYFPGVMQSEREVDHSYPASSGVIMISAIFVL